MRRQRVFAGEIPDDAGRAVSHAIDVSQRPATADFLVQLPRLTVEQHPSFTNGDLARCDIWFFESVAAQIIKEKIVTPLALRAYLGTILDLDLAKIRDPSHRRV